MADNNNQYDNFFQRLSKIFRSGPSIRRRIKGRSEKGYYDHKVMQGNYGYRAGAPFGFGRENSPMNVLGSYGTLDRMARYSEFASMEYCLHGDTKIAVQRDGEVGYETLRNLAIECDEKGLDNHKFVVFSYDHNTKRVIPTWAKQARKTRTDDAWKVTFEDGTEIIGTANHKLLSDEGCYVEIGRLKKGRCLKTFQNPKQQQLIQFQPKSNLNISCDELALIASEYTFKDKFQCDWDKVCLHFNVSMNELDELVSDFGFEDKNTFHFAYCYDAHQKQSQQLSFNSKIVAAVEYYGYIDLYDLTVDGYKNFATDTVISHNTPEIAGALTVIADEVAGGDEKGKSFHIFTKNPQIKQSLDELFYDVMNVEFNLKPWVRNLVKFGDHFCFNEVVPDFGVVNAVPIPPSEIEREEGYDLEDPYAVRFKWTARGNKILENWQVSHFRLLGNDLMLPYGTSILEPARRVWRVMCLKHDTPIWTSDGWKEIKNVEPGDTVYSYNWGDEKSIPTKVKAISPMGKQKLVEVHTSHRKITVTRNHGLLVRDKNGDFQYKKAEDLVVSDGDGGKKHRNSDKLILPKIDTGKTTHTVKLPQSLYMIGLNKPFDYHNNKWADKLKVYRDKYNDKGNVYSFLNAAKKIPFERYEFLLSLIPELKQHDTTVAARHSLYETIVNANREFVVDKEFMRLFGFLLGDGWIRRNDTGAGFALGVYENQNQYYISLLERFLGKKVFETKHPESKAGQVNCSSKEGALLLKALGFISGFSRKRVPSWVFDMNAECQQQLLKGIHDADGSDSDFRIWLSNKNLIEDVRILAQRCGVQVAKESKLASEAKTAYSKSLGRTITTKDAFRLYLNPNKQSQEPVVYEAVNRIVEVGEDETWDLQVENELHNFVAEGIVSHNTMLEDAMLTYRVVRSPERRVFYIDVGNMAPNDVPSFMEQAKATLKTQDLVNDNNGQMDGRHNPMPIAWDTKIPLLDGRNITIKKLAEEYESGKENWVHSINDKSSHLVPGKVVWCGKNYTAKKLIEVELDDGTVVKTAPEHPFILRDGKQVRADELEESTSLMPFYRNLSSRSDKDRVDGYYKVYDPAFSKFVYAHKFVAADNQQQKQQVQESANWDNNKYLIVHHKDCDKLNNRPDNLEWMGNKDHVDLHVRIGSISAEYLIAYSRSEEGRRNIAYWNAKLGKGKKLAADYNGTELHKQHNEIRRQAQYNSWENDREYRSKSCAWKFDDKCIEILKATIINNPTTGRRKLIKLLRANSEFMGRFVRLNENRTKRDPYKVSYAALNGVLYRDYGYENGIQSLRNELLGYPEHTKLTSRFGTFEQQQLTNHKVKSIRVVEESTDVYCMTVVGPNGEDDRHNFALTTDDDCNSGVFVMNSLLDDFFIPVRGQNTGTRIDTLQAGQHVTATEDVEYIQQKLFAALQVPKPYINFNDQLGAKASLSQIDVRFSRTIASIQKVILAEMNKLAMIHLFAQGFDGADLVDFELKLSNPSSIAQQQKLELWTTKFDIGGTAKETELVDQRWVQKNILELSDEEMAAIEQGLKQDRLRTSQLDAIAFEEDERQEQNTVDTFDPSNYDVPGANVEKAPMPDQNQQQPDEGDVSFVQDNEVNADEDNVYEDETGEGETPIKASPFLTRHKRNRKRRKGSGRGVQNTAMPDVSSMLNPRKNRRLRDVYDQDFLNNPTKTEGVDRKPQDPKEIDVNSSFDEIEFSLKRLAEKRQVYDSLIDIQPTFSRETQSIISNMMKNFNEQRKRRGLLSEEVDIEIDEDELFEQDNDEVIHEAIESLGKDDDDSRQQSLQEIADMNVDESSNEEE